MAAPLQSWTQNVTRRLAGRTTGGSGHAPLLTASSAWLALQGRTGIPIGRATFYRWLSNGKIFSVRIGTKMYIPLSVIEEIVRRCQSGEGL